MSNFKQLVDKLQNKIIASYEDGVSMQDAEKLASEFLHGQLVVSSELRKADLDSRTRKSGVKAIRAAIYLDIVSKADKKPVEAALASMLDSDELVKGEQASYDLSEVDKAELERLYDVFAASHVHYRNVAKGSFGG